MAKRRPESKLENRYDPVPHTDEDTRRMLADPAFKAAYDALEAKYQALESLLRTHKQRTRARANSRSGRNNRDGCSRV